MRKRLFSALLGALLLCPLLLSPALAIAPSPGEQMEGIDVSVFQGDIDFNAVRDAGIQVVYIRAGYGPDGVDDYLYRHYGGARAAGLRVGFYYYLDAFTPEEARLQARHFAGLIRDLDMDCRPALDFEALGDMDAGWASAVASAFLEETELQLGRPAVLYADSDVASHSLNRSVARWPLWVADWEVDAPRVTRNWDTWAGWQYTDQGRVPGVSGDVDRDLFTPTVFLQQGGGGQSYVSYTVRPGDTLWALSIRFHTTVAELASLNHIQNPDLIYVGQVLKVPAADYLTYTVKPGDTLWGISLRCHTTVAELVRYNQISNPDLIYPGDTIRIPV